MNQQTPEQPVYFSSPTGVPGAPQPSPFQKTPSYKPGLIVVIVATIFGIGLTIAFVVATTRISDSITKVEGNTIEVTESDQYLIYAQDDMYSDSTGLQSEIVVHDSAGGVVPVNGASDVIVDFYSDKSDTSWNSVGDVDLTEGVYTVEYANGSNSVVGVSKYKDIARMLTVALIAVSSGLIVSPLIGLIGLMMLLVTALRKNKMKGQAGHPQNYPSPYI